MKYIPLKGTKTIPLRCEHRYTTVHMECTPPPPRWGPGRGHYGPKKKNTTLGGWRKVNPKKIGGSPPPPPLGDIQVMSHLVQKQYTHILWCIICNNFWIIFNINTTIYVIFKIYLPYNQ